MAVDSQGRYQLVDIRDRVRRLLDAVKFAVDTTSGIESALTIQDQSVSNTEIINQVNESLMGLYVEMLEGRDSLFAQTTYLSVSANNIGPYNFPPSMFNLRWMKWKPESILLANVKPEDWYPMAMVSDPNDTDIQQAFKSPTWRWEGDTFVLNKMPTISNPDGIQINYTALPNELVKDADTLTAPARFVRVVQQAVIYDCVVILAAAKKRLVSPEIATKRNQWHERAVQTVTNAYRAESVQMIAPQRMIRTSFSGRLMRAGRNWW